MIGITGRARSGKDTVASLILSRCWGKRYAYADHLKKVVMVKFGLTEEVVNTQKGKDTYLPHLGMTVGEVLQKEGTEATRNIYGQNFWVDRLMNQIVMDKVVEDYDFLPIITDVRFDNEALAIKSRGGIVLEVVRPNGEKYVGSRDPNHASEQPINRELVDFTLHNDGTLGQLTDKVFEWVEKNIEEKYLRG